MFSLVLCPLGVCPETASRVGAGDPIPDAGPEEFAMTLAMLDVAVAETLECPHCLRPLTELGFVYSGRRIVPRQLAELKGFVIRGTLEGLQYGCLECHELVFVPAPELREADFEGDHRAD
jgi:hypothetical protein